MVQEACLVGIQEMEDSWGDTSDQQSNDAQELRRLRKYRLRRSTFADSAKMKLGLMADYEDKCAYTISDYNHHLAAD
jgi:hypothetical protein